MPFRFTADFRPRVLAFERQLATKTGSEGSRRAGSLGEPWGHRPFVSGDDPRRVDWNVFARLDELHVRQPGSGEAPELLLLLDRSASMADEQGGKDRMQRELAVAMGWLGLAAGGVVQVAIAGEGGPVVLGRWQGPRRLDQLLHLIENLPDPSGPTWLAALSAARHGRERMVSLFTDGLVEPLPAALLASLGRAGAAHLCLLSAACERHLPAGASRLFGAEGEAECSVDDGAGRDAAWTLALAEHEAEWRRLCGAHAVRMVAADDTQAFEDVLLPWLVKGRLE